MGFLSAIASSLDSQLRAVCDRDEEGPGGGPPRASLQDSDTASSRVMAAVPLPGQVSRRTTGFGLEFEAQAVNMTCIVDCSCPTW